MGFGANRCLFNYQSFLFPPAQPTVDPDRGGRREVTNLLRAEKFFLIFFRTLPQKIRRSKINRPTGYTKGRPVNRIGWWSQRSGAPPTNTFWYFNDHIQGRYPLQ